MCFRAEFFAAHAEYERIWGVRISYRDYLELYWDKSKGSPYKTPKAMDDDFVHAPRNQFERQIAESIQTYRAGRSTELQQELFAQSRRLADAERKLASKATKAASESQRIATNKIAQAKTQLADLTRTEQKQRDLQIYPGMYCHVMVVEDGERVLKPMRYQCRPCGKPAFYDKKYPGTYNARRDNLEGFWKGQFGVSHGVAIFSAFYENVARHASEGRELAPGEVEENVVLEFRPVPRHDMLVACLWSHWQEPGQPDLLSFAAITDEPPAEVAAAGHDRCIVPIKPENLDAWLDPRGKLDDMYAILDDRDRPYYEHRLAA